MLNRIIKIIVKPDYAAEVQSALIDMKAQTVQESGNKEMRLFVDKNQAHRFFVYERWQDETALAEHLKQPYTGHIVSEMQEAISTYEAFELETVNPAPLYEKNPKKAHPQDDVFVSIFIFRIKPESRVQLLEQFATHITHSREEEGNLLFDIYTVKGDENTLCMYSAWRKESDLWDVHFNKPYAVATGKLMHACAIGELEQYMNYVTEFE